MILYRVLRDFMPCQTQLALLNSFTPGDALDEYFFNLLFRGERSYPHALSETPPK